VIERERETFTLFVFGKVRIAHIQKRMNFNTDGSTFSVSEAKKKGVNGFLSIPHFVQALPGERANNERDFLRELKIFYFTRHSPTATRDRLNIDRKWSKSVHSLTYIAYSPYCAIDKIQFLL
jgi:hypothetical protein